MLVPEIALWLVVSYGLMSVFEWLLHSYPMHSSRFATRTGIRGPFERHTVLHHGRWFRVFDDEPDRAAKHVSFVLSPVENTLGLSPVAFLIWLVSPVGAATFVCFVAAHAVAWTVLHSEMHAPKGRWFSRLPLYWYLRNYHKDHHEHPATNFNIVCVGCDHLFGTLYRGSQ